MANFLPKACRSPRHGDKNPFRAMGTPVARFRMLRGRDEQGSDRIGPASSIRTVACCLSQKKAAALARGLCRFDTLAKD